MNLGIFGGSFSPVHQGHFEIVSQLLDQSVVDKIFVVPAYQSPFKAEICPLSADLRLRMLKATFSEVKDCSISTYELEQKGISYTYKTVKHFSHLYPNASLNLILGADAFEQFYRWKEVDQILQLCHIITVGRLGNETLPALSNQLAGQKRIHLELSLPQISSTEIRNLPFDALKSTHWLHPNALEVWLEHQV